MGAITEKKTETLAALTADVIKDKHAVAYQEIYNAGLDAGTAGLEAKIADGLERGELVGLEKGKELGASVERARIADVEAQMQPGCEEVIKKCKAASNIDGGAAAKAVIKFQNEQRELGLGNMKKEAAEAVEGDGEGGGPDAEGNKDFKALCDDYQKENKCSKGAAIQVIAMSHPDEHKEYIAGLSRKKA